MMKRVTKAQLETLANNCNREAPQKGWTYGIDWAYGQPRLVLNDAKLCCRDVSPRLPSGHLAQWIWAFLEGVRTVKG